MQSTDDHVEWAVVHRWRELLSDPPEVEFDVTLAFAVFSSIVCWTLQRLRGSQAITDDRRVGRVWGELQRIRFADVLSDANERVAWNPPEALGAISAADGFIWLRDVMAHGDARQVRPINSKPGRGGVVQLLGFRLTNGRTATDLDLDGNTMKSLGIALADRFCGAFGRGNDGMADRYFVHEARQGVVLTNRPARAQ